MSDDNDIKRLQLELGGSHFEMIEFILSRQVNGRVLRGRYGVNVAKVREVVRMPRINPLASRVRGVAGVFELRGVPIPAVHLAVALGDSDAELLPTYQIIVTEFSRKRAGFVVDQTLRIRRVSWDKVLPPTADASANINGMTLVEDNEFLFILDLERILMNLEFGGRGPDFFASGAAPPTAEATHGVGQDGRSAPSGGAAVLLVEDSAFIRHGVRQALQKAGYRIIEASDGVDGLRVVEELVANGKGVDAIVTDIEMPRMDGLTFVRRIRAHPVLGNVPVIFHTSLSGGANQSAGLAAGANGYVIKNDFGSLFGLLRSVLQPSQHSEAASA